MASLLCIKIFRLPISCICDSVVSRSVQSTSRDDYCYRRFFFLSSDFRTRGWHDNDEGMESVGDGVGRSSADLALNTRMVSTLASLLGLLTWELVYTGGVSSSGANCSSDSVPRTSRPLLIPFPVPLYAGSGTRDTWFPVRENGSSEADRDLLPRTGSWSSLLCLLELARELGTVRTRLRRGLK